MRHRGGGAHSKAVGSGSGLLVLGLGDWMGTDAGRSTTTPGFVVLRKYMIWQWVRAFEETA